MAKKLCFFTLALLFSGCSFLETPSQQTTKKQTSNFDSNNRAIRLENQQVYYIPVDALYYLSTDSSFCKEGDMYWIEKSRAEYLAGLNSIDEQLAYLKSEKHNGFAGCSSPLSQTELYYIQQQESLKQQLQQHINMQQQNQQLQQQILQNQQLQYRR